MYSYGPPHMVEQKQDGQLEHTYSSSVRIQDRALRTCPGWWTIGRSGERGSGISVLATRHDDDDDDYGKKEMDLYLNQGGSEIQKKPCPWFKTGSTCLFSYEDKRHFSSISSGKKKKKMYICIICNKKKPFDQKANALTMKLYKVDIDSKVATVKKEWNDEVVKIVQKWRNGYNCLMALYLSGHLSAVHEVQIPAINTDEGIGEGVKKAGN